MIADGFGAAMWDKCTLSHGFGSGCAGVGEPGTGIIHIYIYICIHTYIHTCMHACMHACMHTYIHTHTRYVYYVVGTSSGCNRRRILERGHREAA